MTIPKDIPTFHINLDKKCAECGGNGAAQSGICLVCTTKAIRGWRMKSATGRDVQARWLKAAQELKAGLGKR